MAISWNLKISILDVATKAVSVTATRTDDTDPGNPKTYAVAYAIISSAAQKLDVLDNIWAQHQAAITRQTAIDNFIGDLEDAAKSNLEARE